MLTAYESKLKKTCLEVGVSYIPPDPGSNDEERLERLYRLVARKRKKILLRARILKNVREIKLKLYMHVAGEIRNSISPNTVCSREPLPRNEDFMQRYHGLFVRPFAIPTLQASSDITVIKTDSKPEPCVTTSMPPENFQQGDIRR
mmetsp:Transcript_1641/g.2245  ORF Transcript_1641/g.2245 Transcript_1641/m.2245 type:complete len:146 (+) Transcript_1641:74-511(+)